MEDLIKDIDSFKTQWASTVNSNLATNPIFGFADLFSQVEDSVVKVKIPGTTFFGAGFFISVGGTNSCDIATSNHVTNGKDKIKAVTFDGRTFDAELQKVDEPHELAIYQLKDVPDSAKTCKPVTLGKVPSTNEIVLGVGEVAGDSLLTGGPTVAPYLAQTLGWIDRNERNFPPLSGEDMNRQMIALFTVGQHGYSGGPIFDYQSNVVGIGAGGSGYEMIMEPVQYLTDDIAALDKERKSHQK